MGFYSTVNEAITVVPESTGNRAVYTRDHRKQARTHLNSLPEKMYVENTVNPDKSKRLKEGETYFNLKEHIVLLEESQSKADKFRM